MARPLNAEVVVEFTQPVTGPGAPGAERCEATQHRFVASGIAPGAGELLFMLADEIVERWPTELVARIEWFRPGKGQGTYSLEAKRETDPHAYERWTDDEEDQLRSEHAGGLSVAEMAEAHGRNQGAVRSRLQRLLLDPDRAAETAD